MANVTEEALRQYIETFHETLASATEKYLPEGHRKFSAHTSLLPAKIIGYVSTQFGTGIEYLPAEKTEIEIRRGSARIEDLLFRAPSYMRSVQAGLSSPVCS